MELPKLHANYESSSASPSLREPKAVTVPAKRFWLLSVGIYIGLFLSMMDSSIVASSLHTISIEFGVFVSVNWVALAYTLAECSCGVVFARISDIIGRRNAFAVAKTLFFGCSLACGFSQNLNQLIAFRALQGVGGAGLYSLTMVILPEVCPDHLLEYMAGLAGVSIVVACIVGPIVGGILTHGPICAASTSMFLLFWPREEDILPVVRRSWRSFDYAGSFLLVAAAVLLVFAFQNVGVATESLWDSASFIAPVAVGLGCWVALFMWQYTIGDTNVWNVMPAIPLSLFRNRFYASGVATTLFLGFPLFVLLFSVPLRAQLVSDKSALVSAAMLLPMLVASACGCVVAVAVNAKRNFLPESMLVGASLSTLGCALLTTLSEQGDDRKLLAYITLAGLGGGFSITSATAIVAVHIPPLDYAPAQGVMGQARVLGGSLGIAMSSVLLHNQVAKVIVGPIPAQLFAMLQDEQESVPRGLRSLVQQSCARAFRTGMIASAVVSGFAIILAVVGFARDHKDVKKQRLDLLRADVSQGHDSLKAQVHER
ncbi:hypothetical protein O9K51_08995 [Purpureocillium lavendulum]|uniref:Major facilitator superfamily (MFS) profile domain-containing protein n=1 Tax=Purpureocillium lavendulum TaxID=1247861 RepID=A0AB34FG25_9HYPO|nr:hypothetical protein O9K51_08995 [Purpureocillium lavendulum]